MKELAVIDSDHITYRCAASAENMPLEVAINRCDDLIRRIQYDTHSENIELHLGGKGNFRYDVYSAYKANRVGKPPPVHLEACREHLVIFWKAIVADGVEADDTCAMALTKHGENAILVSLDKDLLQVPGWHFNFVKNTTSYITPIDGWRNFFAQLIAGDGADNIPSYDGKIRHSLPQFIAKLTLPLWEMTNLNEMYAYVQSIYENNALETYAECLYILRDEEDSWLKAKNLITVGAGVQQDSIPL